MSNIEELTKKAIQEWGSESQLDMIIEECAELINAIQKWRRHRVDSVAVLEEGVDVELMIRQLKQMLGAPALWKQTKEAKLARLKKLLMLNLPISVRNPILQKEVNVIADKERKE